MGSVVISGKGKEDISCGCLQVSMSLYAAFHFLSKLPLDLSLLGLGGIKM